MVRNRSSTPEMSASQRYSNGCARSRPWSRCAATSTPRPGRKRFLTPILRVAGRSIFVLHDRSQLVVDPVTAGYAAVVFGHSHQALVETHDGVLYLNPGSAGPRRFRLPVTVGAPSYLGGPDRARDRAAAYRLTNLVLKPFPSFQAPLRAGRGTRPGPSEFSCAPPQARTIPPGRAPETPAAVLISAATPSRSCCCAASPRPSHPRRPRHGQACRRARRASPSASAFPRGR